MVVGPSATPVEWRGASVKVARRPPTFGNARSSRRHRHLGRAAGDKRGKDHTNRSSDPIADAAREHEPGGPPDQYEDLRRGVREVSIPREGRPPVSQGVVSAENLYVDGLQAVIIGFLSGAGGDPHDEVHLRPKVDEVARLREWRADCDLAGR